MSMPPAPTIEQQLEWEREARDKGITDPQGQLAYAQEQWMKETGVTLSDISESGEQLPGKTVEIEPGVVVPVGAEKVEPGVYEYAPPGVEKRVRGGIPTAEPKLVRVFTPESTLYQMGFKTQAEYQRAQRVGLQYGPHEGEDIDKYAGNTIIILNAKGRPIGRATQNDIAKSTHETDPVYSAIRDERYRLPIKNYLGKEILINPTQARELAELEGESRFNYLVDLKVIPEGSRFISGRGNEVNYQTPESIQEQAEARNLSKKQQAVYNQFKKENVMLKDGTWINKEWYDSRTAEERYLIQTKGVKALQDKFEAENTQLKNGEWVSKEFYSNLKDKDKTYLNDKGVQLYNVWVASGRINQDITAKSLADIRNNMREAKSIIEGTPAKYDPEIKAILNSMEIQEGQLAAIANDPKAVVPITATFIGERFVPYVYTLRHWDELSTAGKAVRLSLDTLAALPVIIAISKTAYRAIDMSRHPILRPTQEFLKAKNTADKAMTGIIAKEYGKEAGNAYAGMVKAENNYALAYARAAELTAKGKDIPQNTLNQLSNNASNLYRASSDWSRIISSKNPSFEMPYNLRSLPETFSPRDIIKDLPKSEAKNIRGVVESLIPAKTAIKLAEADLSSAEKFLREAMNKYPAEPDKWIDLVEAVANKKAVVSQLKSGSATEILSKMAEARQKGNVNLANQLENQYADLIKSTETDIKVKYNEISGKYEVVEPGGILKTATPTVAPTTQVSGSPVWELTPTVQSTTISFAKGIPIIETKSVKPIEVPDIKEITKGISNPETIKETNRIVANAIGVAQAQQTSGATEAEIKSAVENAIDTEVSKITSTEVANEVAPLTQSMTQISLKTATATAVTPTPPQVTPPVPTIIPKGKESEEEKKKPVKKEDIGAFALRQGELQGKDVVWMVRKPYKQKNVSVHVGEVPPGVTILPRGKGSAKRSIQVVSGKPPKRLTADIGFQDATITRTDGKLNISYKPDPKLETKSDIELSTRARLPRRKMPRITPRTPRLRR